MGIYIVAKFNTDWSVFADARVLTKSNMANSRADNSDSSGLISSIIKLIRDLMVIYILTKFGADWLIFVDVLTRKLWTDGRTKSDHNSSLSTPCSGELKTEICVGKGRKHCGKRKNAGYQHFLLFPLCFQKLSFPEVLKVGIMW